MHDDYMRRIDEIIPEILEQIEKSMAHRKREGYDINDDMKQRHKQLLFLASAYDQFMLDANRTEELVRTLHKEFIELLIKSKRVSTEFTPEDIIKGGDGK